LLQLLRPAFGDELFLALEEDGRPGTSCFNQRLAVLAQSEKVRLLATHNVHYVLPEDDTTYRMVNCIRCSLPLAGSRQAFLHDGTYELKTPAQMRRTSAHFPAACDNTLLLAKRCLFTLGKKEIHHPIFLPENGEAPENALRELCLQGLSRENMKGAAARGRLERELAVIEKKKLSSYFLIVHDIVSFAHAHGIPVGPGRGSAGGSLTAYLLGITRVDPLAHGLYFERFLSEDRVGFPDIDLDVCQRRRDELLVYLRSRYGRERVAQVSAFSTLGVRAAVREVGKILDITGEKVAALAEALPRYSDPGEMEAAIRQYPEFRTPSLREGAARSVLAGCRLLEGLCRHLSTHASGVIIGAESLVTEMPLCRGTSGEILTQWDKDDVEAQGFLKIDILGSRNITVIHDTICFLRERQGIELNIEQIPLDDRAVFAALRRGDSLGCFQLESAGMRRVLRKLAPERLGDLVHLLSLYRPGPWESGMVESFIARRHGRERIVHIHPVLAALLDDTYGLVLYQEQVMRIACEVGGYLPGEADRLRRDMSRRSLFLQSVDRKKFLARATKKGFNKEEASAVFDYLCRFAGYSFNKAHSVAYALVSYWTAFLKTYYPVEFYAALLSSDSGYYGPAVYVQDARTKGVAVLPPHVNKSGLSFFPEGDAVRAALPLVRDLGGKGAAALLLARGEAGFSSLADFCRRLGRGTLRRSALANLARAGAFDGLGLTRRQVLATLDSALQWAAKLPGQMSLLELLPGEEVAPPLLPDYTLAEKVAAERVSLGMALSAHPLTCAAAALQGVDRTWLSELCFHPSGRTVTVAGMVIGRSRRRVKSGGIMLTLMLSDESGLGEAVFYPAAYQRLFYRLNTNSILVTGKTNADGDGVIAEDAAPLLF
jgi:DNA polymerase-3 subunit alpha